MMDDNQYLHVVTKYMQITNVIIKVYSQLRKYWPITSNHNHQIVDRSGSDI